MTLEGSTFPPLTPALLDEIVQRILRAGSPRRIVLSTQKAKEVADKTTNLNGLRSLANHPRRG